MSGKLITLLLLPILTYFGHAHAAVLSLAENGRSDYSIYYSAAAADSVKLAATELQLYIKKSTGVSLPISTSDTVLARPIISLGVNKATQQAAIAIENFSEGGYRLLTQGKNLYILGIDVANGKKTAQGGDSTGTLNGTYTFLEDYLGIRWLMPGEIGEYVPQRQALVIPVVDRTDVPGFPCRQLVYVQNENPQVMEWLRRQKQGCSVVYNHGHNWTETIPSALYREHPDWFAMQGDIRPAPVGRYKLETTNPQLVQEFSKRAVAALQKNPQQFSYSISPSDGDNWSTSPESRVQYDKDPHGKLSITPLILDFYNNVARTVAKQLPDRQVCGYIYASYLYPPAGGIPPLAPNLCIVVAPSINYGYGLYRVQTQQEFEKVMQAWSSATSNLGYYDLPVMFQQQVAAPNPPGLGILAYLYPRVAGYGAKKIYIYGVSGWGHGAITNYLLVRLNWNPKADVAGMAREFYTLAYGDKAGAIIARFYAVLDTSTKSYHQSHARANHWLSLQAIEGIYVPVFSELEKLFVQARQAVTNSREETRLKLLQLNMALFRQYLSLHELVKDNAGSPFTMGREEVLSYLNSAEQDISFAVDPATLRQELPPLEKLVAKKISPPAGLKFRNTDYLLRGKSRLALFTDIPSQVQVSFANVILAEDWAWYVIRDRAGNRVAEGDLMEGVTVSYAAKANEVYLLDIMADSARYRVDVDGASYAISTRVQENGLHLFRKLTPLYFYTEDTANDLITSVTKSNASNSTTAIILSPDGKQAAMLGTGNRITDSATLKVAGKATGIWTIRWKQPLLGSTDHIWVSFGDTKVWVATGDENCCLIVVDPGKVN